MMMILMALTNVMKMGKLKHISVLFDQIILFVLTTHISHNNNKQSSLACYTGAAKKGLRFFSCSVIVASYYFMISIFTTAYAACDPTLGSFYIFYAPTTNTNEKFFFMLKSKRNGNFTTEWRVIMRTFQHVKPHRLSFPFSSSFFCASLIDRAVFFLSRYNFNFIILQKVSSTVVNVRAFGPSQHRRRLFADKATKTTFYCIHFASSLSWIECTKKS